jgi:2-polyprenyl-6-methoxyphenol hydroxylase-like FAD-dependent oxidoreductase
MESEFDTDVVIAGGGPTGLMLACELGLAGVGAVVLERLDGPSGESRAGGMHARTMEVLDQRGMLAPFLAEGRRLDGAHFSGLPLDLTGSATRFPYLLVLLQRHIERLLAARVAELGVPVRRRVEVTGVRQDEHGVDVETTGAGAAGGRLRARYLVGCDGGRSAVRRLAGVGFPGTDATLTALLGDVELAEPPAEGMLFQRPGPGGNWSVLGFEPGWHRLIITEFDGGRARAGSPDLDELRAATVRMAGTDFGMHSPRWISRFGDAARQADRYRSGRVLLAGDAAHVHYPAGGQGLNTGVQDAVNLGWKLAAAVRGDGGDGDELLDSYHAERHPVAARVLQNTRAQTALSRPDPLTAALRETVGGLLGVAEANRALALMITALDVRYDVGGPAHPLLGLRAPDADLTTAAGPARLSELLHTARPVLLDLGAGLGDHAVEGWSDRVDVVVAAAADPVWTMPVGGEVAPPPALLVRPDGHVAWVASGAAPDAGSLRSALATWCGPARAAVAVAPAR